MRSAKFLVILFICFGTANQLTAFGQTNRNESAAPAGEYYRPTPVLSQFDKPYSTRLIRPDYGADGARAWSQTKSIFIYGFGVIGVLAILPQESTGWESDANIFDDWVDNVSEGPEWDRNKWAYNYIGHTYFGGVYYQVARKSGYRQWDAFVYTTLMSTFYWEYGIEAFAEVPSIQDLVFTPLAGWVYGEWAYRTEKKIRDNQNEVLGSGFIGGLSLFLLDPVDSTGQFVNHVTRRNIVKAGYGYFSYVPVEHGDKTDHQVYLHVRIPIGAAGPKETSRILSMDDLEDPVDTGIVGISAGQGYTKLDDKWELQDDSYTKLTMGLYFNPRFSLRFGYAWTELEDKVSGNPVDYENYSLDTQIYLNAKHNFRPYVTAGLGEQVWERDNNLTVFQWNGGLGAHWQLHRKWALNADWINYYSPGDKTYDQQFNLGIIYRFGRGEHNDW